MPRNLIIDSSLVRNTAEKHQSFLRRQRVQRWLTQNVDGEQHYLEAELILLAFSTGVLDAASFPKYHCFVSNQTGNTILFAVTAFSLFGDRQTTDFQVPAPHIAVSLGFFLLGVFTAGQTANHFDSKFSRWWLLATNISQTALVLIAALIGLLFQVEEGRLINSAPELCEIGLLAFMSGAQVAMSRQLSMPEIPTTQATAAYVDLFIDPNFFAPITKNRSRNRRILFLVTLCVGGFVGAPAYRYVSSAFAILIAGLIKVIVTIMMLFNATEKTDDGQTFVP